MSLGANGYSYERLSLECKTYGALAAKDRPSGSLAVFINLMEAQQEHATAVLRGCSTYLASVYGEHDGSVGCTGSGPSIAMTDARHASAMCAEVIQVLQQQQQQSSQTQGSASLIPIIEEYMPAELRSSPASSLMSASDSTAWGGTSGTGGRLKAMGRSSNFGMGDEGGNTIGNKQRQQQQALQADERHAHGAAAAAASPGGTQDDMKNPFEASCSVSNSIRMAELVRQSYVLLHRVQLTLAATTALARTENNGRPSRVSSQADTVGGMEATRAYVCLLALTPLQSVSRASPFSAGDTGTAAALTLLSIADAASAHGSDSNSISSADGAATVAAGDGESLQYYYKAAAEACKYIFRCESRLVHFASAALQRHRGASAAPSSIQRRRASGPLSKDDADTLTRVLSEYDALQGASNELHLCILHSLSGKHSDAIKRGQKAVQVLTALCMESNVEEEEQEKNEGKEESGSTVSRQSFVLLPVALCVLARASRSAATKSSKKKKKKSRVASSVTAAASSSSGGDGDGEEEAPEVLQARAAELLYKAYQLGAQFLGQNHPVVLEIAKALDLAGTTTTQLSDFSSSQKVGPHTAGTEAAAIAEGGGRTVLTLPALAIPPQHLAGSGAAPVHVMNPKRSSSLTGSTMPPHHLLHASTVPQGGGFLSTQQQQQQKSSSMSPQTLAAHTTPPLSMGTYSRIIPSFDRYTDGSRIEKEAKQQQQQQQQQQMRVSPSINVSPTAFQNMHPYRAGPAITVPLPDIFARASSGGSDGRLARAGLRLRNSPSPIFMMASPLRSPAGRKASQLRQCHRLLNPEDAFLLKGPVQDAVFKDPKEEALKKAEAVMEAERRKMKRTRSFLPEDIEARERKLLEKIARDEKRERHNRKKAEVEKRKVAAEAEAAAAAAEAKRGVRGPVVSTVSPAGATAEEGGGEWSVSWLEAQAAAAANDTEGNPRASRPSSVDRPGTCSPHPLSMTGGSHPGGDAPAAAAASSARSHTPSHNPFSSPVHRSQTPSSAERARVGTAHSLVDTDDTAAPGTEVNISTRQQREKKKKKKKEGSEAGVSINASTSSKRRQQQQQQQKEEEGGTQRHANSARSGGAGSSEDAYGRYESSFLSSPSSLSESMEDSAEDNASDMEDSYVETTQERTERYGMEMISHFSCMYLRRVTAAAVIQRAWRCSRARLELYNRRQLLYKHVYTRQKAAALCMCGFLKTILLKSRYTSEVEMAQRKNEARAARERAQLQAAQRIARAAKRWLTEKRERDRLRMLLNLRRDERLRQYEAAAVLVQRWWRLIPERKAYWRMRTMQVMEEKRIREEQKRLEDAATKIQAFVRGVIGRREARQFKMRRLTAIREHQAKMLQSADLLTVVFREYMLRCQRLARQAREAQLQAEEAAQIIQAGWKAALERRRLERALEIARGLRLAASTIQRAWRRCYAGRELRYLRHIARTVQEDRFVSEYITYDATIKLQSFARVVLAKCEARRVKAAGGRRIVMALFAIQAVGRGYIARDALGKHWSHVRREEARRAEAALSLQQRHAAVINAFLIAKESAVDAECRRARILTDKLFIRRLVRQELRREAAATTIQRAERRRQARVHARAAAIAEEEARAFVQACVIKMQCAWRMYAAKVERDRLARRAKELALFRLEIEEVARWQWVADLDALHLQNYHQCAQLVAQEADERECLAWWYRHETKKALGIIHEDDEDDEAPPASVMTVIQHAWLPNDVEGGEGDVSYGSLYDDDENEDDDTRPTYATY